MICSQNEKYLLKFISSNDYSCSSENDLMKIISKLGIKVEFKNHNPIYQIIDELTWESYFAHTDGK